MKHAKSFLALLLALTMALTLSIAVFADGETGTITIDNAINGQTYTIYRLLDLESYNAQSGAYAYKAAAKWSAFVDSADVKGIYLNVDKQGYVTWVAGADAAAFAKLAQKYAADNAIANEGSQKAAGTSVKFENLQLGYYLVDSTLGTLCSLDTTKPNVTIKEKNAEPTNVKTVEEDSTGSYGAENDADIGQTVNFKSTITAQTGAENYIFHDKMSAGLTFGSVDGITLNGAAVAAENYEVKTSGLTDDCTFEVVFTQAFCNTLKENDKIVISYTATLNDKAVVGLEGNPNESKIEYGESGKTTTTPPSTTKTYTWDLELLKYGNNDESKTLEGAQFVLLNSNGSKVALFTDGKLTGWSDLPADGKTWPAEAILTSNKDGLIHVEGLDADAYSLREVVAPRGFNVLPGDVAFTITGKTKAEDGGKDTYTTTTVKVNNQSGADLPSTGGMGTTIFYIVGGLLAVGAAILLVTKKRMSKSKN